jgi:hypothetical protein
MPMANPALQTYGPDSSRERSRPKTARARAFVRHHAFPFVTAAAAKLGDDGFAATPSLAASGMRASLKLALSGATTFEWIYEAAADGSVGLHWIGSRPDQAPVTHQIGTARIDERSMRELCDALVDFVVDDDELS